MTKIYPVGHRVLIRPRPLEEVSKGGIVLSYGDQEKLHKAGTDEGTVIAIGPTCWKSPDLGYGTPDWKPWVNVGDKVLFTKYSQKRFPDPESPDKELWFVNDTDIQGIKDE